MNKKDINVVIEALKWRRVREGAFSSNDPLLDISTRLSSFNEKNSIKDEFKTSDVDLMLETLRENITFMSSYKYQALTFEQAKAKKDEILIPLKTAFQKLTML